MIRFEIGYKHFQREKFEVYVSILRIVLKIFCYLSLDNNGVMYSTGKGELI